MRKQVVTAGRRATEAAEPTMDRSSLAEQTVSRIAFLFGQVSEGATNKVEFIRMNSADVYLVRLWHENTNPTTLQPEETLFGAKIVKDDTLRPGTCVIDKLGKRELYF